MITAALAASVMVGTAAASIMGAATAPPEPPVNVVAVDKPYDGGGTVNIAWEASPSSDVKAYEVFAQQIAPESQRIAEGTEAENAAVEGQTEAILEGEGVAPEDAKRQAQERAAEVVQAPTSVPEWESLGIVPSDQLTYTAEALDKASPYSFMVRAINDANEASANSNVTAPVIPAYAFFDLGKLPLLCFLVLICGAVFLFVVLARGGMPMKIRTIAGLKAVDEAVGRATEMGRSILYINGIQDMDDLQTVAGVTVLGRVAKTAAEYDAKIEVPTSRSLVMTAARETVQSSYFTAGRPDAYNPDLIYYVTDEQFGFVAYVAGMMTREKPAACFYMGAFFAESLILAETGNSVGAIQIAGTASPAQLPFFVAACDYTLIGEEFFAASAYLSGQPDQLGSLKGQDIGKLIVGFLIVVGVVLSTLVAITAEDSAFHQAMSSAFDFLVNTVLGS
jgi:hypothetical protein